MLKFRHEQWFTIMTTAFMACLLRVLKNLPGVGSTLRRTICCACSSNRCLEEKLPGRLKPNNPLVFQMDWPGMEAFSNFFWTDRWTWTADSNRIGFLFYFHRIATQTTCKEKKRIMNLNSKIYGFTYSCDV